MKRLPLMPRAVMAWWLLGFLAAAHAVTINVQYSANPLFSSSIDPTAKAAISAAAADLSAAITTTLSAINSDTYVGENGTTTATLDWYYQYTNPVSGATEFVDPGTIGANTVTLFAGARNLTDTTLGLGGHAGLGLGITGSGTANQWLGAVNNANAGATTILKRGAGPIIGNPTFDATLGGTTATVDVDYGVAYGSLSLDWDTNNNGVKDTDAQLNGYWHFDHTSPVVAGKNDLYSVALHEMLHALGIGTSQSWTDDHVGTTWTGSNVLAIPGSGTNLVYSDGSHIAAGVMSQRITDGADQEVAMDPTLTVGTRKYLTLLDLAFLRDIGYSTITPVFNYADSDFDTDGDVDDADLTIWRNAYRLNTNGDADGDGDTDGRDFSIWQHDYTGALLTTTVIAVPEPAAIVLLLAGSGAMVFRRPGNLRKC